MSSDVSKTSSPAAQDSENGVREPLADSSREGADDSVAGTEETVRGPVQGDAHPAGETDESTGETVQSEVSDGARPAADGSSRSRTVVTAVAAVWLVVALVLAGWFGAGWVRAMWFTDGPRTDARNSALDGARQAAINLTSMNPADVDGSIATMRSSMTGDMLGQLDQNRDRIKDAATKSGTKVESKVLGAALNSLNSERDRATGMVVLQLTQNAPNTPAQSFRVTWTLDMKKDGDTWKAEQANSLGQPVSLDNPGAAGQGGQPPANGAGAAPVAPAAPAPAPQPGS
ncbi:MAG: hypothetical protein J2P18_19860 [Nocardia sp.]|nr:hypothetical protein [Nocardia sp.]